MDDTYLRPAAAFQRFGVHRNTLIRWANDGLIGRSRVGRAVWYRAQDIADVIASHETRRTVIPMVDAVPAPTLDEPAWVTEFWESPA